MKIPILRSVVGDRQVAGPHPIDREAVDFGNSIAEHRLSEIIQAARNERLTPTARLLFIRGIVLRR